MTAWTDDEVGGTVWSDDEAGPSGGSLTGAQIDVDADQIRVIDATDNRPKLATVAAIAEAIGPTIETDSANSSFAQSGTETIATDVQDVLRERVSIFHWMSAAEKADVRAGTFSVDLVAAFARCTTDLTDNMEIILPAGGYLLNSAPSNAGAFYMVGKDGVCIRGAGNATRLKFGAGWTNTDALFFLNDASGSRGTRNILRDFVVEGQGASTDGLGIKAKFQTNLQIFNVHINNVRNTALDLDAIWDLRVQAARVYGCGAQAGTGQAVYIHSDSSGTGTDNTNFGTLNDVTIERSYGKSLYLKSSSGIFGQGVKLHGRSSSDSDYSNSKELLYVSACTLVHFNGYQFMQCRVPSNSGAVRITGGQSTIILNNGHIANIDDAANKHDIYIDSNSTSTRLYLDNARFNDTRATAEHVYLGSSLGQEPLWLGANVEMTSSMAVSDQRTVPILSHHLATLPSARLREYTAVPTNAIDLDGGVHVLDFEATGNAVNNDMIGFRASAAWHYAGLMEWSFGWDGTITSGKDIAAKRFPLATELEVNILQVDIVCGTAPTEDYAGGNYWSLVLTNGTTSLTVILDDAATGVGSDEYVPTATGLAGSSIHYRAIITAPKDWGAGSLIRARLVETGTPGTDPANVHVSCTYNIKR